MSYVVKVNHCNEKYCTTYLHKRVKIFLRSDLNFFKTHNLKLSMFDNKSKSCNTKHLTTIFIELEFLWDFVRLSLITCSLYHEKLFLQEVNDISTQVFNNFFSASDIMEAVRGRLCFYRYE